MWTRRVGSCGVCEDTGVREVVEKDRTIASVTASYGLVAQAVGNWVAKCCAPGLMEVVIAGRVTAHGTQEVSVQGCVIGRPG